jgi:Ser/Thr protein kinase RdoA (MazF antagonist)
VAAIASAALGVDVVRAVHLAVGWGNENWRAAAADGTEYVVKFGPPESGPKWAATARAYAIGASQGVPVPELLSFDPSCASAGGWVVRVLRWVDGRQPERPTASFFAEVGRAVRALHDAPVVDAFSSRLDGSAPSFARWDDYIAYRLPSVVARCRSCDAFAPGDLDALVAEIESVASVVAGDAMAALCHRDLYLGNLLSADASDEHLAAILDFDGAEAWDPPIDVVKLRWLVEPDHPGAVEAFLDGYGAPRSARWDERVRLAELLELTNAVANAVLTKDPTFERSARDRLAEVR